MLSHREIVMECPSSLMCERCGCEAGIVMYHGHDANGRMVLRPATLNTPEGLYVFMECPIHGCTAQCIAPPCDAHLGQGLISDVPQSAGTRRIVKRVETRIPVD